MTVDKNFPDTKRRLRSLAEKISDIEHTMSIAMPDDVSNAAIYRVQQHEREYEQTQYLIIFYERQSDRFGGFSRFQWAMFVVSLAVACTLLILFFLDRLL